MMMMVVFTKNGKNMDDDDDDDDWAISRTSSQEQAGLQLPFFKGKTPSTKFITSLAFVVVVSVIVASASSTALARLFPQLISHGTTTSQQQENNDSGGSSISISSSSSSSSSSYIIIHHPPFNLKTFEPIHFHQSGFGLLNFHHHYHQSNNNNNNNIHRFLSKSKIQIPISAVKHAIPSIGEKNIINLAGHYVHDEYHSPWSSLLYNRPKEELEQEQREFVDKMKKVRKEWGCWNFKDYHSVVRPLQDFSYIEYRDIKNEEWVDNVWQMDEKYVRDLIQEGRKLVDRMTEGIYAEFGYPTKKTDGSVMSTEEKDQREEEFKIHISEDTDNRSFPKGFVRIRQVAFDGLVRKLLHAMITNDDFYFVLGGHSAAGGHGNDHAQQKTMQFNNIMEPVFHKLGIRLVARNLAMGGYGTLHFSAGQAELYGEKDFLMWDSALTEKSAHDTDLFNKQAIMNGERIPVIMTSFPNDIVKETHGKAWIGDILPRYKYIPETKDEEQGRTLPWLVQFQHCATGVSLCGGKMIDKYDAKCWVDRKDVNIDLKRGDPPILQRKPASQLSWHPGWRYHRIESRKTAMLFLAAFKKAFDVWEEGIEADGFPLAEKYWHVGNIYKDIRNSFHNFTNGEGKGKSACEQHYDATGHGEWCRVGMHGMSTFRPINLGQGNGIIKNVKASPSGWVVKAQWEDYYTGPDLLPLSWKIPDGHVDVHAIAIATSYEAPLNENLFDEIDDYDDDEDDDVGDAELGRMRRNSIIEEVTSPLKQENKTKLSLRTSEIVQGEGWGIEGYGSSETEYCDGSPQSECGRLTKYPSYDCLLQNDNDRVNTLSGDGTSGWLVVNIPGEVKNGIIWAKIEWWHPRSNWTAIDEPGKRHLEQLIEYPDDVKLDIAINGKIYATWDKEKIMSNAYPELAYNQAIYRFATNDLSINGKNVELGLRITSAIAPKVAGLGVAHIYWS